MHIMFDKIRKTSRFSFIKAFVIVLVLLIGMQLMSMIAYQRNRWLTVLRQTSFISVFEVKSNTSSEPSTSSKLPVFMGKVETVLDDTNRKITNQTSKSVKSIKVINVAQTGSETANVQKQAKPVNVQGTGIKTDTGAKTDNVQETGTKTIKKQKMGTKPVNVQDTGAKPVNVQDTGAKTANVQGTGAKTVNVQDTGAKPVNVQDTGAETANVKKTGKSSTDSDDTEDWKRFIYGDVTSAKRLASRRKPKNTGGVQGSATEADCENMKGGNYTLGPDKKCIPECPHPPKNLVGPLSTFKESPPMEELEKRINWTLPGGRYLPKNCWTKYKVAIVVPYRNRATQLSTFLLNMHHLLKRQTLDYGIYIVEQSGDTRFNRALLMNIGYAEAIKQHDYNCFVFHDVDLIPEDDRNFYGCGENPRHLSAAIDKFNYKLPYGSIFGGVSQVPRKQFEAANGYSNKFFGWGGEDDDMWNRLRDSGFKINRYAMKIARYKMIRHTHEKTNAANPMRFKLLREGRARYKTDGINSLKYKVLKLEKKKLLTLVTVDVNEKEIMES